MGSPTPPPRRRRARLVWFSRVAGAGGVTRTLCLWYQIWQHAPALPLGGQGGAWSWRTKAP
jgi:hypothetical protein